MKVDVKCEYKRFHYVISGVAGHSEEEIHEWCLANMDFEGKTPELIGIEPTAEGEVEVVYQITTLEPTLEDCESVG